MPTTILQLQGQVLEARGESVLLYEGPVARAVICFDSTAMWRCTMTRCDVALVPHQAVPSLRRLHTWTTWWVMQGGDDRAALQAVDRRLQLNQQVMAAHQTPAIAPGKGEWYGVRCALTGDGKAMMAANWAAGMRCWVCSLDHREWSSHLHPCDDLSQGLRYGAFLRTIPNSISPFSDRRYYLA